MSAFPGALDKAVVDWHLELHEREMRDHVPLCESAMCAELGRGEHEAQWWARSPCGAVDQVCEQRRLLARSAGGWRCKPGCDEWHPYPRIQWFGCRQRRVLQ